MVLKFTKNYLFQDAHFSSLLSLVQLLVKINQTVFIKIEKRNKEQNKHLLSVPKILIKLLILKP